MTKAPKGSCISCAYVQTFNPRDDERHKYGFVDLGYGCKKPGFEGYTTPFSTCEFYQERSKP